MNILHVIPTLKKGGAERLVLDICRALQRRESMQVKLLLLYDENEYRFLSESLDVEVTPSFYRFHVAAKAESDFTAYRELIHRYKPDVIHTHLFEAEFFTRHCLFSGVKYITHLHDNMVQFESLRMATLLHKTRFTNWLEKRDLIRAYRSCANSFIANSEDTAAYFRQNIPADLTNRIIVLDNAIDLDRFPFMVRKPPAEEITLVSTGSLVPKKNHGFLIHVVSALKSMNQNVKLTILGDGPLHQKLAREIAAAGLQDEITLPGKVDDVAQYLFAANVYVHAATYEPFGLAIVEAMATGLPVVCLDGKGNRGIVDDGLNGYMLKEPDPKRFAEKISRLAGDREAYATFSLNAGTKARRFSITDYTDKLVSLYQNLFPRR
jgi:glycosyltransferase involved in cell wall biosynthesis